ncbi:MAG: NADH-quinone oxidoreductase subunit I [Chloroflexi bacterium]|nr:NADH-quinone oxidoreductase subunit I [Chloroflexota bacterium]
MIGLLKGLNTTLKTLFRRPVTVQYPDEHLPLAPRYKGFPALLWDDNVQEPYCVGCQVCARYCPTECITVTMKDNTKFKDGTSTRKKIVDFFQIDMAKCIVCAICVEVCNFDAIVMSDAHEESVFSRGEMVADLNRLLEMGRGQEKKLRKS